jgi:hypothetical protein
MLLEPRDKERKLEKETPVKNLFGAALVAIVLTLGTSAIFACGGMATVDPPTLQLEDGPSAPPIESVLNDLGRVFCIC